MHDYPEPESSISFAYRNILYALGHELLLYLRYGQHSIAYGRRGVLLIIASKYMAVDHSETLVEDDMIRYCLRPTLSGMWMANDLNNDNKKRIINTLNSFNSTPLTPEQFGIILPITKKLSV